MMRNRRPPVFKEGFTRVKNLLTEELGTVESILSTQVTVQWDDEKFGFLFNADYGTEWKIVEGEDV